MIPRFFLILVPFSFLACASALRVSPSEKLVLLKSNFATAYSLIQEGEGRRALPYLERIRGLEVAVRDYTLFYLGRELHQEGRCEEARRAFRDLLLEAPESRFATVARQQVRTKGPCPSLVVLEEEKKEDCTAIDRLEERGECYFRQRRYEQAKKVFKPLSTLHALIRLSQSAARSQDEETVLWANRTLRERYPRTQEARRGLEKIASLYQERGDYRLALPVWRDLMREATSRREKGHALERLGWCHFRLGEYGEAAHHFNEAEKLQKSSFALYWRGRALRILGRQEQAREAFEEVLRRYPRRYYAIRSAEALYRGLPPGLTRQWWPQSVPLQWESRSVSLKGSRDLRRIEELSSLGLGGEAEVEIRRFRQRRGSFLPDDFEKVSRSGGDYLFEVQTLKEEDPEYRLPHAAYLFSKARALGLRSNPFLFYAMMRQESQFRSHAHSRAGAVGLLQVMPQTGQKIAERARWSEFDPLWLSDPFTNIELALRYLQRLEGLFPGHWSQATAAYSAGEQAVGRWIKKGSYLPEDVFIEEIPYRETRHYVKNVYANFTAYRSIYR